MTFVLLSAKGNIFIIKNILVLCKGGNFTLLPTFLALKKQENVRSTDLKYTIYCQLNVHKSNNEINISLNMQYKPYV